MVKKFKAYIAAPLCSEDERKKAVEIDKICKELGIETYLPHRDGGLCKGSGKATKKFFDADVKGFEGCDVVVAVMDNTDGTTWEIGYAYARGIPIVGVVGGKLIKREEELSLMLANSVEVLDSVSELRKWLEGFVEKK